MPDPWVLVPPGAAAGRGPGDRVGLPDDVVHHLSRVLRLRPGATVVAADGAGTVVPGRLVDGDALELVAAPEHVDAPRPRVHVWQGLGKGRKQDEVVRVLTELGVDAITAVTSGRTVVDLEGKAARVRSRWEGVARSACEQSRRAWLPEISGPVGVEDLLDDLGRRPCLLAHVGATTDPLSAAEAAHGTEEIVVAVGPEGGWTGGEVAAFRDAGATVVGLGPTVLRTEHAATVLASIVMAAAGRMRP